MSNPTTYTIETPSFTLTNPSKSGYTFSGWSGTGLSGVSNLTVSIPKGSTGNLEFTANWTAERKEITIPSQITLSDGYSTFYTNNSKIVLDGGQVTISVSGYHFGNNGTWYKFYEIPSEMCPNTSISKVGQYNCLTMRADPDGGLWINQSAANGDTVVITYSL